MIGDGFAPSLDTKLASPQKSDRSARGPIGGCDAAPVLYSQFRSRPQKAAPHMPLEAFSFRSKSA